MSASTKPMFISASQIDTFEDCPRKWYLQRKLKLKEPPKAYFTFGTVLHACAERWLSADDSGRVPSPMNGRPDGTWQKGPLVGQKMLEPVDVFPEGWETVEERDGSKACVTPNEAKLIRKVIEQAIERGVLERWPHRQVERKIMLPVIDGVELIGYIDLSTPAHSSIIPEITDHKTFSRSGGRFLKQPGPTTEGGEAIAITKPYRKGDGTSPNCLAHNQQVLTYATVTSILDDWEGPVTVTHNQFPKFEDGKGPRSISAVIAPERLVQHWEHIKELAAKMVRVKRVAKWNDTPPPSSPDACSRYGGCPFQGICGMKETPDTYRARVEKLIEEASGKPRMNLPLQKPRKRRRTNQEATMGIFDSKPATATATGGKAKGGALAKAKAAARGKSKTKDKSEGVNGAATAGTVQATTGAPWANPKCKACSGRGVSSNGKACMICDKTAKREGRPGSEHYVLEVDEGVAVAVAIGDSVELLEAAGAPLEWDESAAAADAPEAAQEAAQEPAAPETDTEPEPVPKATVGRRRGRGKPEAEEAEEPAAEEAETAVKPRSSAKATAKGAGRPRAGVTILIGVSKLAGPDRPTVLAQSLLEEVGAELAADMGAESYWALDTWKRRDAMRQAGAVLAARLGRSVLLVPSSADPDVESMVAGMMPHAEAIYEGVR